MNFLKDYEKPATHISRPIKLWHLLLIILIPITFLGIVFFWSPRIQKNLHAEESQNQSTPWSRLKNLVTLFDGGLRGERGDRINILLLGKAGASYEGPNLTDTIIIASIKPKSGDVALLSVPRDLFLDLGKWDEQKINTAYALAEADQKGSGGPFAVRIIEKTFKIPIHYYIVADFNGFRDIVNALRGIRVYVERSFEDREFPGADFQPRTVAFTTGWQTFSGEAALQFARSRHGTNGENTDFARSRRQQKIIVAIGQKLLSRETLTDVTKLVTVASTLRTYVETNIGARDLVRFGTFAANFNVAKISHVVLDDGPNGVLEAKKNNAGAYILVPKYNEWGPLRDIARNIFDQTKL